MSVQASIKLLLLLLTFTFCLALCHWTIYDKVTTYAMILDWLKPGRAWRGIIISNAISYYRCTLSCFISLTLSAHTDCLEQGSLQNSLVNATAIIKRQSNNFILPVIRGKICTLIFTSSWRKNININEYWQQFIKGCTGTTLRLKKWDTSECLIFSIDYTGWAKKVNHKCSTHNFVKYWLILTILSLL